MDHLESVDELVRFTVEANIFFSRHTFQINLLSPLDHSTFRFTENQIRSEERRKRGNN